ncbi:mucin-15 [Orycteropus afer afer]|uniref:Mucin-15 n=1 Tax=Orycteropus afer afer TaxID=1230840 RepID=A0A8B7AQ64_ORYAF|nr:mucin-15 [Orycteropus afer afer]
MLTLVKILLIPTLFSSLLLGSFGKENSETSIPQNNTEVLQTMRNETVSLENEEKSDKESGETSNPKTSNSSALDPLNKIQTKTTFSSDWSTDNSSDSITPQSTISTSPPLVHSFVSNMPWNSSVEEEHSFPVLVPSNATLPAIPSSLNTLTNDTIDASDNSSMTVTILPPAPTTISVTPLQMEPTTWLTTTSDSLDGFTPYQEITTPQPTLKFTNSSKIFPNTADPQEENRNTGVVFGAILGAILGASLLSLVGYLLCGKRKTDSFSHRRLYDDRNEPVLRLDNAPEPYDMSFGNSNYYNPTGIDSSMPEGREHAHDGIPMDDIPPLRTSV